MSLLNRRSVSSGLVTIVITFLLSLPAMAQMGPKVVNFGAGCFGGAFIDPSMSGSRCQTFLYDFDACSDPQNGGEVFFRLVSGPGVLDTVSGVWQWNSIPASASGQSYSVVIRPLEVGIGLGAPVTMTVTVLPDTPPQILSGCAMSTALTGQVKTTQMTSTVPACDPTVWTAQLLSGDMTAQVGIDGSGMASFSATVPDVYVVRLIATEGAASDTCDHTYIVHGGGSCCNGLRGNINAVGVTDLADLSILVQYLTTPYTVLPCFNAANINGLGIIDLADLVALVSYLTSGTPPLQSCQ